MKTLLMLLVAAGATLPANAQTPNTGYSTDALLSRWVVDINLLGGLASQTFTTANSVNNYPNALNANMGNLTFKNGYSFGADGQLGFFFGQKRHFGLGAGIMYMQQQGDAALDNFHIEYQATDSRGNIFRQVVTGNNVSESITATSINIPVVLKYKNRFSKHWGFTADAGALINLQIKNAYTTHASFNDEAIYQFAQGGDAGPTVYDNSPIPSENDWLITKAEFLRNNPNGNYQDYVNAKRALGFNVGEGLTPNTKTGNTSYTQGSVGFIVQPSMNYFLSDKVALNFGVFYMYQPFKNNAQSGYRLTDGQGNYSSVLNNVTASTNQDYGINIGARFFLGKKHIPWYITSIDQNAPSQCGMCDGSFALNGLTPNQAVRVDYSVNGAKPVEYSSTVQADGKVKITNLCAGSYTGITATIKKQNAAGKTVTLSDPPINISSQTTANPAVSGGCDGSVTFNGLYAGKSVSISYNMNGNAQPAYSGFVKSDNSVTMNGLCEGKYTGIMATVSSCSAQGADFTLAAPTPPPAPPVTIAEKIDISTPIMFDVNEATIHPSSYPVIEEAAEELKENRGSYLTINGHADASGSESFNRVLSLRRANSVKKQLTKKGINPNRLKTRGYGSSIPAATNSTTEGKQQNRRAVMKITPAGN